MKSISAAAICAFCLIASAPVLHAADRSEDSCTQPPPPPFSKTITADSGPVRAARYVGATSDYPHGVLGDTIEASALLVRIDNGTHAFCTLISAGADRVFEDTAPRIFDLDGDGVSEVIAVASHANHGARLEIYGHPHLGDTFQLLAHTPYIGTRFRWLAPIGAADLDGDGQMEIAFIDRPHLAKTLRIWRYQNGALIEVAAQQGYSNHKIGWPFIAGGIRNCGSGPEMVLATGNWSRVIAAKLRNDIVVTRDLGPYWNPESIADAMICK